MYFHSERRNRFLIPNRPALLAVTAFALGIIAERAHSTINRPFSLTLVHSQSQLVVGASIFAAISTIILILVRKRKALRTIALFVSIACFAGAISAVLDYETMESPLARVAAEGPDRVAVQASVTEIIQSEGSFAQMLCEADSVVCGRTSIHSSGSIYVTFMKDSANLSSLPQRGSRLILFGRLQPFLSPSNPDEYARDFHIRDKYGATAKMEIGSRFNYRILGLEGEETFWQHLNDWGSSVRLSAEHLLGTVIGDSVTHRFVEAALLGERSEISSETMNDFSKTGLAHLLAVSGFSVAVIAGCIAELLVILGIRRRTPRIAIAMLGVATYSLIVGLEPSVIRAALMIEFYLLCRIAERKPDALNIACGAALSTLLLRPFDLFDPGFLLSYSAVIGIALLYPEMRRLLPELNKRVHPLLRRIYTALPLSISATLATIPATALEFHRISFIGAFTNALAIPIDAIVICVGFFTIPLTLISMALGRVYGDVLQALVRVLFHLTHSSSIVPIASASASTEQSVTALLLVIGICYAVRASDIKHLPIRLVTAAIAVPVILSIWPLPAPLGAGRNVLSAIFFDVGQGDCILIHSPKGNNYLIDFGGVSGGTFPLAEQRVLPFLETEGFTSINAAFLTHLHIDHYGGIPYFLENEEIQTLYWTGEHVAGRSARDLDSAIQSHKLHVAQLAAGDIIHPEKNLTFYVLHPPSLLVAHRGPSIGENLNNGSLAIKVVYGRTSFLLLGDIEGIDEQVMFNRYRSLLRSDVVKVAHHGSRTSSTEEFVKEVHPRFAVISVGEHNHYGHPARLTLNRWHRTGAEVLRTDRDGAILIHSDGSRVWRESGW